MSTHVNDIKKKDVICPLFVVILVLELLPSAAKISASIGSEEYHKPNMPVSSTIP
jgi:hypothetical protein